MSRKQDEEDEKEAAREREAKEKEAKRRSTKEVEGPATGPAPTVVGGLPAEDYLTQQEKNPNADPVNPPVEPVPAEVLTIPAKQPYPTGNPPPPVYEDVRQPRDQKGG